MKLLQKNHLPDGFEYPSAFLKIINLKLLDLEPWSIMEGDYLLKRYEGLKERYPERNLVPFSRRLDNDDLACWDKNDNSTVIILHDFATQGWENRKVFSTFWDWFREAIEDMIVWE